MAATSFAARLPRITPARLPVIGVVALMAASLAAAIIGPAAGGRADPPPSTIIAQRTLRFEDRADGAVVVRENGTQVAVFEGEQGFIRGILRGFARGRHMQGLPATEPFHLAAWADGRLTIEDMANHTTFELQAFGSTNATVFAGLLPGLTATPAPGAAK